MGHGGPTFKEKHGLGTHFVCTACEFARSPQGMTMRSQRLRAVALLVAGVCWSNRCWREYSINGDRPNDVCVCVDSYGIGCWAGLPVAVAVTGTPTSTTDWVSISAAGSASTSYVTWKYLNSSVTAPATIVGPNPTVTLTSPTTPGQYVYRYFKNNNLTMIANRRRLPCPTRTLRHR